MVKKSKGKRRGVQRGVQKHKIRISNGGSIFDLLNLFIPKHYVGKFYKLAEECFFLYARNCCRFYLVPLIMTSERKLAVAPRKHLIIHYGVISVLMMSMLHKLGMTLYRLAYEDMNIYTFICAACFLTYLVAFTASFPNLFQVQDTIDLINGWPKILACYPDEEGKVLPLISNTKTATVVAAIGVLAFVIATAVSCFSLIFRALPVCFLPMAEAAGLVPVTGGTIRVVLKFLFWPLELVTYLAPMLLAGWSAQILMLGAMVVMTCTERIRKMPVNSFEDRLHLWNLYIRLQAFNRILNSWIKYMIVLTISSASSTIILCLYITLKHTELPTGIYIIFPYVGLNLLGFIFWLSYEVTMMIRSSEAIIGELNSTEDAHYPDLPPAFQMYIKKRGRATKALAFNIGDFMDFSLDVPAGIWEEILNQLFFLLSF